MPSAPSQGGKEGEQWVRVIDGALQEWEAENRKRTGRPKAEVVCDTHDLTKDGHCSRGIRRRIQKRAIAGDDQAQAIVAGCTRRKYYKPVIAASLISSRENQSRATAYASFA